MDYRALRIQPVDLRRHNEVALSQSVNFVGPERDFNFAPRQQNIRVVSLLLG